MEAAEAASSTFGVDPWAISSRAAARSALRVRSFCRLRPCANSWGISAVDVGSIYFMVPRFLRGTVVPLRAYEPGKEGDMGGSDPIVRAEGEGEKRWFFGGGLHTWKASAAETNGSFFVAEDALVRGKMTPLHRHPQDELVYVIEGEILYVGNG